MLESGRILYEKSDGKERKAYRICSYLRSKKGAEHCKAIDIEENRVVFLKLVELEGESLSVTDDPDKEDEIRNIQREGRFQFYYPFIEQVYGCRMLYTKHKDGVRTNYFGVSVEYVEGKDVLEARKEFGNEELTPEQEIGIFRNILQFLYGMRYYLNFANKKYLHRDIKPGNIRINVCGNVKIIDFDVAHISGSDLTQSGRNSVGFSPGYTSPAIVRGDEIYRLPDVQDEFYSAGRLIFYWLNGVPYYTETECSKPYDEAPRGEIPYIKDPALRFGTKTERFRKEYQTPEYEAFRDLLDKMCHGPSEERYEKIEEIIEDYTFFLMSKYGKTEAQLEALMKIEDMPLLGNNLTRFEKKAPVVCSKVKGRKTGKKLLRYSMRDIKADGSIAMTIYNADDEVYYIPAGGTRRREYRENEDYRIRNQDVFVTENGTEITFSL